MSGFLLPLVNGLAQGSLLFITAAGLTLVFGVMHVVNFAHGHFMMLAGYLMFSGVGALSSVGPWGLLALVVAAGIAVAALGAVTEVSLIRRLYGAGEMYMVLGTYGVLLVMQGVIEKVWGLNPVSVSIPDPLRGGVAVGGVILPVYSIVLILAGVIIAAGLITILQRTGIGRTIRAAAADRDMTQALGVNVPLLYTAVFAVGALLAGIAGALAAPPIALHVDLGVNFVIQAFAVVVVGGLGSVHGALIGAMLLGVMDSYLGFYFPILVGVSFYVVMATVLVVRPQGLFGQPIPRSW